MTRKECLEQAMGCVLRDRNNEYGKPEDCFGVIANFWSVYLGKKVYPHDVAMMMSLLKIARIKANKSYGDGYVDLAGYAACGAECAGGKPASKPKASAKPEFKPGDRVEVQMVPDSSTWASATITAVYRDKDTCEWRYCVDFEDGWAHLVVPSVRVRPASAPKAEGVEALVQKDAPLCGERCEEFIPGLGTCEGCRHAREHDAPQTPQELCQHIVDCNPATFGCVHKPTGEELAEMAEEEKRG